MESDAPRLRKTTVAAPALTPAPVILVTGAAERVGAEIARTLYSRGSVPDAALPHGTA